MATVDQGRSQRADEERPQAILPEEAEFRPQFLLRDGVRADRLSGVQGRKARVKPRLLAERSSPMVNVSGSRSAVADA
jgi:hypothetical protein